MGRRDKNMADSKREIVKDAVREAVQMKNLAVEAAKNELVESMTPAIKRLVEKQIRRARHEDVDRLNRARDGYGETEFEESKEKGERSMPKQMDKEDDLDMESLSSMFPGLSEDGMGYEQEGKKKHAEPDGDECAPSAEEETDEALENNPLGLVGEDEIPTLGEGEDRGEGDMDEEIEISEAELRKVYESAMQAEAAVTKGFKDISPGGELDDVVKDTGIADKKSGESMWDQKGALPPDKQDWTVKEIKQMIRQGIAENKALRIENKALRATVQEAGKKLHEVNLFNAKVLHVNRMLTAGSRLTFEQKKVVVESIDSARSIGEVKKIYATLEGAFRTASGTVNEGARRKSVSQQSGRSSGGADQKVLRESAGQEGSAGAIELSRWAKLAGLK